jgi:ribonuclease T1
VFFSGRPPWWQALRKTGRVVFVAGALLVAGSVQAKGPAPDSVAFADLPVEAQATHKAVVAGGPFPYSKDGSTFGNRERVLPKRARGYYREYTVVTPGARNRGARRIVCGGEQARQPEACYYTGDHYLTFRRIAP